MASDADNTLQALKLALQMEADGKQFYLKASRDATNEPGKRLFSTLAEEEDIHARKFTEIYNSLTGNKPWPKTDFRPDGGRHLRTVFAAAIEQSQKTPQVYDSELSAARTAMEMENKTFDYYQKRIGESTSRLEREFYEALSAQEKEHNLVLLDYYEFLKEPAAWFVKKEHPSLDGG